MSGKDAGAWERDYRLRGERWGGAVRDLPAPGKDGRVLELGCGNGKTLAALAADQRNLVGIDLAPAAIALACRSIPSPISLLVADAGALPFKDGSYDLVCAVHVLGHLKRQDRVRAAAESSRVLGGDGRLFFRGFSTKDMRCGKGVEEERSSYRRGDGILTHYFTEGEVAALFAMLDPVCVRTRTWTVRIRGTAYLRAEIEGLFEKRSSPQYRPIEVRVESA